MASSALSWSAAENTGLRTSRSRSGLSVMRASNLAKRVRDGLALALVLGERKQGGRVTSGYAGNNRVFLCHAATSDDD